MVDIIDARVRLPFELRPRLEREKPSHLTDRYDAVLNILSTREKTLDDLLADMQAAGVTKAIVHAEYEHGDWADELNESLGLLLKTHADRFWGFGTVSLAPLLPRRAVSQVRHAASTGFAGINVQPAFFGLPINDPRLYPVYAAAEEERLVVAIHTGINYSAHQPMQLENPILLDEIACHFPDLLLVACHGGWPWIAEMVAVARRHPNVYIDFGGLAPKYVGDQGTGWDMMFRLMDSVLAEQVLFATDWPVFPIDRAVREWTDLGFKDETLTSLFARNVERLLCRFQPVALAGGRDHA